MRYPARIKMAPGGGFVVTFRDIPEATAQGDTMVEVTAMAELALLRSMEHYFDGKRSVPQASPLRRGEHLVALPPSAWAKVLLRNEMLAQGVTPSELARRLHTRPQDVNRVVDLGHLTKIDTLSHAMQALGRRLEVQIA